MAHAAGDSHEYPVYGYHFRAVFPIRDINGDLITGATGLDSEVSIDQGTAADCTNEAIEIATSTGMYYLDFTGTEITAKSAFAKIQSTTTDSKDALISLYPIRLPALQADTAQDGGASTITLASGASSEDDFYNGLFVGITNNSPAGVDNQLRRIISYNGSTKIATVDSAWGTNPTVASTYEILIPEGYSVASWGGGNIVSSSTTTLKPEVDLYSISDDATAADNLELQYDTTGLTGDTFPATQLQLGNIALTGAAVSTPAKDSPNGFVITLGENEVNNEDSTHALDGITHDIEAQLSTTEQIDVYYEFTVGGNGIPTSVSAHHQLDKGGGATKNIILYAYNWGATTWDQIGTLISGTSLSTDSLTLFTSHVGTGVNIGLVRVRYDTGSVAFTSTTKLLVDQIFVEYAIVNQSVGYQGGAVWIDTINGTAGTESFVNGTADNPVDSLADAITIASNLSLVRFHVAGGSSITFAESHNGEAWGGDNWTLALGTQSISGSVISGASISGVCTGASPPRFERCIFGATTVPPCRINGGSGFNNSITLGSAGNFDLIDCGSLVAGTGTPTLNLGAAVGASNISIRDWKGGLTFNDILAGDVISLEGVGGTVTVNGTGGSLNVRGIFEDLVDNSSASVMIDQTAMMNRVSSGIYSDGVWIDTNSGNTGVLDYVDGTADQPAGSIADAYTIATSIGVKAFRVVPGSTISLPATSTFRSFIGTQYTVALNNADIEGTQIEGAIISGIATGGTDTPFFKLCGLSNVTLPPCNGLECGLFGTLTIGSAGNYTFANSSNVFDISPVIDYGALLNASEFYLQGWNGGGVEIQNAGAGTGTYKFQMSGDGDLTINANCSDTTNIVLRGNIDLTNNSAITSIVQNVNYQESVLVDATWDEVLTGMTHNIANSAAKRLRDIASSTVHTGTCQAGSTINTIVFDTAASATDGAYDPALVSIVDGTGAGQTRLIYEYTGSSRIAVVDRNWKITPDNTSEFVIVADAGREHVNEGRLQAATTDTATLNTLASATDDVYIGQHLFIRSGTGDDQVREVIDYNGTSKVATVFPAWSTTPDNTSGYVMLPIFEARSVLRKGFAQAGTSSTITLDAGASSIDDFYNNTKILIVSGIGSGQERVVADYDGTTKVATITPSWITSPDSTSQFLMDGASVHVATANGGYLNGAVWIDTVNGSAGTTLHENGTVQNPVDNIADATTIATSIGSTAFRVKNGSSITLAQAYNSWVFIGSQWTLALGGQSISSTLIKGATLSGTGIGSSYVLDHCIVNAVTLADGAMRHCNLSSDITMSAAGSYILFDCYSSVAGTGSPSIDFGAVVLSSSLSMRHYSGGIEIKNIGQAGTDNMSLEGNGQLIMNANCAGGTIAIRGNFDVTDNASGAVTLSDDARFDIDQPLNMGKIDESALAASNLALTASNMVVGTVDTTNFSATTTQFEADDITTAVADHYNGRIIIFTSNVGGVLKFQATAIEDYSLATGRGHFTVTALTSAPGNNDTFIIV